MPRKINGVDYLRVYPGLNDFSDVLEAIPLEMVRHFTLLKEIDAKCTVTSPQLAKAISTFMAAPRDSETREDDLSHIRQLLQELMPCLEEKMHIASMASEAMARHMDRLDADFQLIVNNEIPRYIQVDEDNPAISEPVAPVEKASEKPAASRSETRREAIAAKRAAAAAAAAAAEAQSSRQGTPAGNSSYEGTTGTTTRRRGGNNNNSQANQAANAHGIGPGAGSSNANANSGHYASAAGGAKRRRDMAAEEAESAQVASRRRRGPADRDEPVYCYCEQGGSYGDMVGCDGPDCKREWFHLGCIGLSASPKGQWFCEECQAKLRSRR